MKEFFWNKTCPFCNQGRLFVFKDISHNKLYLHCEECERGYYDLENVNSENSFLTLTTEFESIEATAEDLKAFKWDKYNFKSIEY